MEDWNGFKQIEFEFEGHNAKVIIPDIKTGNSVLAVETIGMDHIPVPNVMQIICGFQMEHISNHSGIIIRSRFIHIIFIK